MTNKEILKKFNITDDTKFHDYGYLYNSLLKAMDLAYNEAIDDAVDLYRNPNDEDGDQDNFDLELLELKK